MNLTQMIYFHHIAQTENMSRSAQELHVSQPGLSAAIKKLEKELGFPLFDRIGRTIALNQNGQRFYRDVDDMLRLLRPEENEVSPEAREELVIYTDSTEAWLDTPINRFLAEHPDVLIHLCTAHTLRQQATGSEIDFPEPVLWTDAAPAREEGVRSVRLCRKTHAILMSARNPLAGRKELRLADLREQRFIFCMPDDSDRRRPGYRLCEQAGFTPDVICFSDNRWGMVSLIEQSAELVTIMPTPDAARFADSEAFRVIPIEEPAGDTGEVWVAWKEDSLTTPARRALIETMLEYCRAQPQDSP